LSNSPTKITLNQIQKSEWTQKIEAP